MGMQQTSCLQHSIHRDYIIRCQRDIRCIDHTVASITSLLHVCNSMIRATVITDLLAMIFCQLLIATITMIAVWENPALE